MHAYHVYILASMRRTLYIGVTSNLRQRIHQHKTGAIKGFTSKYKVNRLVHFEAFADVNAARARERHLKGWVRRRKIALIEAENPEWEDLADRIGVPLSATVPVSG
jgi:putative endonuclease